MSIKVLYVEDELFLGKIVKETLETRGFEVVMESDGAEVLRSFEQTQPDICVLDVMLPNRSGFEIAADIRKLNDDVPILFLTAKTHTDDVVYGFRIGGNDYIRKPFSMEELIVRIENALRVKKELAVPVTGEAIPLGNYQFQLNKQILSTAQSERKLSYRESELLKYLYLNRDSVIDRRDLLNHIWGNDSFFNSRNLDVYITKIRGYLKDDPSLEIITIKGVGYRFVTA
jgi:DNA-binding response OmpR family regulator